MSGPYYTPATRKAMIKHGQLTPTTWANIFAEIVMCQNCARMYPTPECRECEKSIESSMKPTRMVRKNRLTLWWFRSKSAARIRQVINKLRVKR